MPTDGNDTLKSADGLLGSTLPMNIENVHDKVDDQTVEENPAEEYNELLMNDDPKNLLQIPIVDEVIVSRQVPATKHSL